MTLTEKNMTEAKARLAYLAEVQPALASLSGTDEEIIASLRKLVGHGWFNAEWKKAQDGKELPEGRDRGMFALDNYEAIHPLGDPLRRLCTTPGNGYVGICALALGCDPERLHSKVGGLLSFDEVPALWPR